MMRNVIMITTDQHQLQAMSCADSSFHTPNLDRLVRMGVRFTGAITTSAQCSPSRSSWMTGKYPHQVGVNQIGHVLDPGEWGIAKEFNRHGFETVYFGKWHLANTPGHHKFKVTDYRVDGLDLDGANVDPRFHSHKDAITTRMALNYLEDYQGDKPFFMTVSWYMPHPNSPMDGPFEKLDQYVNMFPQDKMPVPDSFYQDDLSTKPPFQKERASSGESILTEEVVKRDAQRYHAMVYLMDRNLGGILDELEKKGLLESTSILFTSDHGDMQGAHGLRLKGVIPYKELYNVPMIVYVPGKNPIRKLIPDLFSTASVSGALLEMAGLSVSDLFEGGSFLPLLDRETKSSEEKVFFEHYKAYWGYHPFIGVQTRRLKYVLYYEEGFEEMYDLVSDPDENRNIAGSTELEGTRLSLKKEVEEWWEATGGLTREPIIDSESKWGQI